MPLLGNPTAAVLYPGKLVFAVLPYAWGARAYIVGSFGAGVSDHARLDALWGTSWPGSALSALAYAFGAPVLFQYCNIIYLIGAAWLPLGFHAVDRWVPSGPAVGLLELAVVLSMQVLGGEPQAAYLLGVAGIGYAPGVAWSQARWKSPGACCGETGRSCPWFVAAAGGARAHPLVRWSTLALGCWLPRLSDPEQSNSARCAGRPGCPRS